MILLHPLKKNKVPFVPCIEYTKGLCDFERGWNSSTDGGRIDAIDRDNPYASELLNSSLHGMERSVVRMKIQIQQARLRVSVFLHLFFQMLSANTVLGLIDTETSRNRSYPQEDDNPVGYHCRPHPWHFNRTVCHRAKKKSCLSKTHIKSWALLLIHTAFSSSTTFLILHGTKR